MMVRMDPLALLIRWDVAFVFGITLAEQAGLPVPAGAVLVAAGALAQAGDLRPDAVLLTALLACLIADNAWFLAGRRRGRIVLAGICRISLSPDTCVRKADDLIARYGAPLLLVIKFIPGVSAVSIPTMGAMGVPWRKFAFYDVCGCLLWSSAYLGIGMIFSSQVQLALDWISRVGGGSLFVIGALFAVYLAGKYAQRRRLRHLYRLVRIAPGEVAELLAAPHELLILDARSSLARADDPRTLPVSMAFGIEDGFDLLPEDARLKVLVTFCTCPNEASAALLAERLLKAGYERVRVLTGGEDALRALAGDPA
jgi:membrane protein DedA with SNARE-associated domain